MNLHIENNNIHVNHDGPDGPQGFSLDGKANITEVHTSIVDGALRKVQDGLELSNDDLLAITTLRDQHGPLGKLIRFLEKV